MKYERTASQTAKVNNFVHDGRKGKEAVVLDFTTIDSSDIPTEAKDALKSAILDEVHKHGFTVGYTIEFADVDVDNYKYYLTAQIFTTVVYVDDVRAYAVYKVFGVKVDRFRLRYGVPYSGEDEFHTTFGKWPTEPVSHFNHYDWNTQKVW